MGKKVFERGKGGRSNQFKKNKMKEGRGRKRKLAGRALPRLGPTRKYLSESQPY
jgi:hypothetical protein